MHTYIYISTLYTHTHTYTTTVRTHTYIVHRLHGCIYTSPGLISIDYTACSLYLVGDQVQVV